MVHVVALLLPAIIPSWRFFDWIAPSPRIEYVLLENPHDTPQHWQEFRPRPAHVSPLTMLKRLFWNPRWNESLFLLSCAERLMQHPTDHSAQEIRTRISAELRRHSTATHYLQFRLVFVHRENTELHRQLAYISPVYPLERR